MQEILLKHQTALNQQLHIYCARFFYFLFLFLYPLKQFFKMSIEVSAATLSAPIRNAKLPETDRRSAGFHPSIWGDHFLSYASNIMVIAIVN